MKYRFILIPFLSILLFSCDTTQKDGASFDRRALLTHMSDTLIIPSYQEFIEATKSFQNSLQEYKMEQNEENLEALGKAWFFMANAWKKAEAFNFGPIETLFIESSIHYTPIDTLGILNFLNSNHNSINQLGSNRIGIAAVEYILFTQDMSNERNLDVLKLMTEDLEQNIEKVLKQWKDAYRDVFISSTANTADASITLLANEMIALTEKVKNKKVALPLGKTDLKEANPNLVEAPFSSSSLSLLLTNLEMLQMVYRGGEGIGFDDYLNHLDNSPEEQNLAEKINKQFDKTIFAANAIDSSLQDAIHQNDPKLDELYLQLINLEIIIKNEMMSSLGLLTTFSDNDGD